MGSNFHSPFTSGSNWTIATQNAPLSGLDRAITYLKNVIVHCDGEITWNGATLTWSDDIHIHFNRSSDGKAIHNSIAANSQAVADNQFAYVTLNETNDTVLTVSVAAITTGAASNFLAYNILVLGYRNTDSNEFYGVYLRKPWTENVATTTERGEVELATDAEVATGTDTERAVTPAALASVWSPELFTALSGDIVLECDPATAGTSAAVLNAAEPGTFTKDIVINLKNAAANLHDWANLALNAATSENVVDTDVAAPAVSDNTPDLVAGTVTVTLTYDTDAGATKTYAEGDTVTLTVSQPTGGILGYPIADATFVDTIVA